MTNLSFDVQTWIGQALADMTIAGPDQPGSGITTVEALADLSRRWPGPLTAADSDALHALCRKIHVARRVSDRYRAGWSSDPAARPIDGDAWRLLIVVLLAYAIVPTSDRGLALKLLNAAHAGLDLAADSLAATTRRELIDGAGMVLDVVLEARDA